MQLEEFGGATSERKVQTIPELTRLGVCGMTVSKCVNRHAQAESEVFVCTHANCGSIHENQPTIVHCTMNDTTMAVVSGNHCVDESRVAIVHVDRMGGQSVSSD